MLVASGHVSVPDMHTPQWELVEDGVWITGLLSAAGGGASSQVGTRRSNGPAAAVTQIRIALRTAAGTLPAAECDEQVWEWTEGGYREALDALRAGESYMIAFTVGGRTLSWELRPVRFLALVDPPIHAAHHLVGCAPEFPAAGPG